MVELETIYEVLIASWLNPAIAITRTVTASEFVRPTKHHSCKIFHTFIAVFMFQHILQRL